MKTLIPCVLLLACIAICSSAPVIAKCLCVKTTKIVRPASLIVDVHVYEPSPYCNKKQVIVTLRDNTQRCLDPKSPFTIKVEKQYKKIQEARGSSSTAATTNL